MCLVCTGTAHVTPNTDFRIPIANLGKHPKTIAIGQTFSVAAEHPTSIMESPITHVELLCVAVEKLYRKRPCDARDEEVINQSLAKNREAAFGEKEEATIRAETVPLSVDKNITHQSSKC